jgi:hypothetical protein
MKNKQVIIQFLIYCAFIRNHSRVRPCELANNPEVIDFSAILDCSQATKDEIL